MVKNYPRNKKQPIHQQLKFKPPNCPNCKRNKWLRKATIVKIVNLLLISKNIKLI